MADWVRPLFRTTNTSLDWHARRIKGLTATMYCGVSIEGPLEVAREDRAEREGLCATCATRVTPPAPRAATKPSPTKKAATKSLNKAVPKKTSSRAPVRKRAGRRGRRK